MPAVMTGAPFTTPAVVVRAVAYGEADRIVTLFTRTHGKVSAMARGAQKSRKRFGAALGLFVIGEATLRERRGAEMMSLESLDPIRDHSELGADVVKLAHASYATELVRELTVPRHADPTLFDLLCEVYAVVAAAPPAADTLRAFELALLDELGLRPVLERCTSCGAEGDALDAPGAIVDPGRGGVVCVACVARGTRAAGCCALPADARARLLAIRELTLAQAAVAPAAPPPIQTAARLAMHALIAAHLHGPIKSLEFISKLRAAEQP
jgi:DNA repair protein RecO (recombination protein O)